jgi:hypothetical protein
MIFVGVQVFFGFVRAEIFKNVYMNLLFAYGKPVESTQYNHNVFLLFYILILPISN